MIILEENCPAAAGQFDLYFNDIAINGSGATDTIYTSQPGATFSAVDSSYWPGQATNPTAVAEPNTFAPTTAVTHYYLDDHLGTAQMELTSGGYPTWQGQFTPFGAELPDGNTAMHYKFTGKERDNESGLDYFGARYYGSNMGRWMSPDWSASPEAVPYSHLDDPQSLNLYGYVRNNPLSQPDLDGHGCPPDCSTGNQVLDFIGGVANAFGSDNLMGAGRVNIPSAGGQYGQALGDGLALAQGAGQVILGTVGNIGGVVLDATGVGAVIGVPANVVSTAVTVDGAAVATTAVVAMAKGSYTNTHASGMTYDGKGGPDRAAKSGAKVEKETGDKHVSTDHTPSSSDRESFKDESRRLDSHGGAKSDTTHNKIDSPGKKYRQQDGSH